MPLRVGRLAASLPSLPDGPYSVKSGRLVGGDFQHGGSIFGVINPGESTFLFRKQALEIDPNNVVEGNCDACPEEN
jgi:hypothetical protein